MASETTMPSTITSNTASSVTTTSDVTSASVFIGKDSKAENYNEEDNIEAKMQIDHLRTATNGRRFFIYLALITTLIVGITLAIYFVRQIPGSAEIKANLRPLNLTIVPDPRLSKVFYGLDYSAPYGAQYDLGCNITQQDVLEHLKLLSQLTTRIRLYGMDCLHADLTLNAIRLLNIEMSVILTIWVDNDLTVVNRQRQELYRVLEKYKGQNISYVSVGNELLLRASSKGPTALEFLIDQLNETRAWMKVHGYEKIPVVTTEVVNSWFLYPTLIDHSDEAWGNVHPFFAGVLPTESTEWAFSYFANASTNGLQPLAQKVGKQAQISEIGQQTGDKVLLV
ncbi:hypothetical protein HDV05_001595 [Chytridiales sp. JEL 0842]|nr:hypothetical protein HDV05_001595 [Chytridiales sp. JEL 0842]